MFLCVTPFLMGFTLKFHTLERELKGTNKGASGFESRVAALEISQTEILTNAQRCGEHEWL